MKCEGKSTFHKIPCVTSAIGELIVWSAQGIIERTLLGECFATFAMIGSFILFYFIFLVDVDLHAVPC